MRAAKSFSTRSGAICSIDAGVTKLAAAILPADMHSSDAPVVLPPPPRISRTSARRASCVTFEELPSVLEARQLPDSSTACTDGNSQLKHSRSANAAVRKLLRMPSNSSIPADELTDELLHAALTHHAEGAVCSTQQALPAESSICDELDLALSGSHAVANDQPRGRAQHQKTCDGAPTANAQVTPHHIPSTAATADAESGNRRRPVSRRSSVARIVPQYEPGAVAPQTGCSVPARLHSQVDDLLESCSLTSSGPMLFDETELVLASADTQFQFDAFELSCVTGGRALSSLAFYFMQRSNLISTFKLNPLKLVTFLGHIEAGYKDNPYHNSMHAADVLQTLHVMLHMSGMLPLYADSLTLLAMYLSAVVHDYEHAGLTNDYLVASAHALAIRYNDRAPLENHHLAAAFTLMRTPDCNFLNGLSNSDYDKMRKFTNIKRRSLRPSSTVNIADLNNTDMGPDARFSLMGQHVLPPSNGGRAGVTRADTMTDTSVMESTAILDVLAKPAAVPHPPLQPIEEAERLLSLQIAFKISDLGHLAEGMDVHLKWVSCLEEEFFRQGDKELSSGLPISPLFDRTKPGVTKSQVGFLEFIVLPMFKPFASAFPGARPLLAGVLDNYKYWKAKQLTENDQ